MEGSAVHPPDEVLVDRFVPFIDELTEIIKEKGWPSLWTTTTKALDARPGEREAGCDVARSSTVTHLALRVSWPPGSALRGFPQQFSFVSSADRNLLVLCVGNAPVCFNASRGFYLVHDAMANSVAVVPWLPPRSVPTMFSHRGIGTGVAVLRRGDEMTGEPFLLAELFLRRDRGRRGHTSNKATLFIWFGSGPASGGWTEKEVTLPFPSGYRSSEVSEYSFTADTVLAVGGKSLCWVDRRWNGWRREWGMDGDGKKMGAGGVNMSGALTVYPLLDLRPPLLPSSGSSIPSAKAKRTAVDVRGIAVGFAGLVRNRTVETKPAPALDGSEVVQALSRACPHILHALDRHDYS
nr:unnamed protein product [Digitaria exilis]